MSGNSGGPDEAQERRGTIIGSCVLILNVLILVLVVVVGR